MRGHGYQVWVDGEEMGACYDTFRKAVEELEWHITHYDTTHIRTAEVRRVTGDEST